MIKKLFAVIPTALLIMLLAACSTSQSPAAAGASSSAPQSKNTEEPSMSTETQSTNALGALTPEDALDYMKETENLVIVDVATTNRYNADHFEGAINIPIVQRL